MLLSAYEPTVLERQQAAVATFIRARREMEKALRQVTGSRECRMDAARRLEVLRREQEALRRRPRRRAGGSTSQAGPGAAVRVVVAYRHPWACQKVVELLVRDGAEVVEHELDNGADVVGVSVAEQPELVMLEDRLLMLPGDEVVREVRLYCPLTIVAVQAASSDRVGLLLEAGAHAVTTRQVPPAEHVAQALALLPRR
jgi:hypothetical protein